MSEIFDQYSRYKSSVDALLCVNNSSQLKILDVGSGESCLLGSMLPQAQICYVDPLLTTKGEGREEHIHGTIFAPELDQRRFDYIVCVDTLEHVPPEVRERFLKRAIDLVSEGIILACPCYENQAAQNLDQYLNTLYRNVYQEDYSWLSEHLQYGLPKRQEILSFFKQYNCFVQRRVNGHVPWLEEFLAFVIFAIKRQVMPDVISALSQEFIDTLFQFDHLEPAYRDIFVITKKPALPLPTQSQLISEEGKKAWQNLRLKLYTSLWKFFDQETSQNETLKRTSFQQITERDNEIIRLNALLKEQTAWGLRASNDVMIRDREIMRLNRVVADVGTNHSQATSTDSIEKIRERDREISRLNSLLGQQSEWGQKAAQDVAQRDQEIARLNSALSEITQWAQKLSADRSSFASEIDHLKSLLLTASQKI